MSILLDKLYIPCRYEVLDNGSIGWAWPGGYCKFQAKTRQLTIRISGKGARIRICIDHEFEDLKIDEAHELIWTSKSLQNVVHFFSIQTIHTDITYPILIHDIQIDGEWEEMEESKELLEFVGDSWTVGYGNLHSDSPDGDCTKAWAALLAGLSNSEYRLIAASGHGIAKNYGENPLQNPSLPEKYKWIRPDHSQIATHSLPASKVFVLAGENDFSEKPWPDLQLFQDRAEDLLISIQKNNPAARIFILCVERGLPAYDLWISLAEKLSLDTILLPNLDPSIPLGHQWHPSLEHHKQIAQMVFQHLANKDEIIDR